MTMNTGKYYVTGGTGARDHAYLACQDALTDRGAWDSLILSGPIDAPDTMPVGSCVRGPYLNGQNMPVPALATVKRAEPSYWDYEAARSR